MKNLFCRNSARDSAHTQNLTVSLFQNKGISLLGVMLSVSMVSSFSQAEIKQIKKESYYSDSHSKTITSHSNSANINSQKVSKPQNHYGNHWQYNRNVNRHYNRDLNHSNYHQNYSNNHNRNYNHRSNRNYRPNYHQRSNHRNRHHYQSEGHHHYHSYGHRVSYLPHGYRRLRYSHYPLYYHSGNYYRPTSRGYIVVRAPVGIHVSHLPIDYTTVVVGSATYFLAHDIYYKKHGKEYVVVEPPEGNTTIVAASDRQNNEWLIYPAQGQSDKELERDRYQCHRWAVKQSGYDPSRSKNQHSKRGDYYRAQAACLEGRGYVVK